MAREIIRGQQAYLEDLFLDENGAPVNLEGFVIVYKIGDGRTFQIVKKSTDDPAKVIIDAKLGRARCFLSTDDVRLINASTKYSVWASYPPHDGSKEEIMGDEEGLAPITIISNVRV